MKQSKSKSTIEEYLNSKKMKSSSSVSELPKRAITSIKTSASPIPSNLYRLSRRKLDITGANPTSISSKSVAFTIDTDQIDESPTKGESTHRSNASKIKGLIDKIMDTGESMKTGSGDESPFSSEKNNLHSLTSPHSVQGQRLNFTQFDKKSPTDFTSSINKKNRAMYYMTKGITEEAVSRNQTQEIHNTFDSIEGSYKYNIRDSKFAEIIELKKRNEELIKENNKMKSQLDELDEFEVALSHEPKRSFDEKRCNILKAYVIKQKRYIDHLNKSFRLMRKFHKDLMGILKFLIELDNKYMKPESKLDKKAPQVPIIREFDIASKVLIDLHMSMKGNGELISHFLKIFNEAYERIQKAQERNEEVSKVFNLTLDAIKANNRMSVRINPQIQKKIKYNYMFSQFINQYKTQFPIYTAFNDFELKDKADFSAFIQQIIKMSEKIENVLGQVKNFEMLKHSEFVYNDKMPEKIISHAADFEDYFNSKNPGKRIFLNSNKIFDAEKSLSSLLNQLVHFHNILVTKRDAISAQDIVDIQENLKNNIEKLLMLGISTNVDFSGKDKIILVTEIDTSHSASSLLQSAHAVERKVLYEIYNEEYEQLEDQSVHHQEIRRLLDDLAKIAKDNNPATAKLKNLRFLIENLKLREDASSMISRLKDVELSYLREFAKVANNDLETIGRTIIQKSTKIDEFVKLVDSKVKDINKNVEETFELGSIDLKSQSDFIRKYKRNSKEILEAVAMVMEKQSDTKFGEIMFLNDQFKDKLSNFRKNFLAFSEKLKDIKIIINRGT